MVRDCGTPTPLPHAGERAQRVAARSGSVDRQRSFLRSPADAAGMSLSEYCKTVTAYAYPTPRDLFSDTFRQSTPSIVAEPGGPAQGTVRKLRPVDNRPLSIENGGAPAEMLVCAIPAHVACC